MLLTVTTGNGDDSCPSRNFTCLNEVRLGKVSGAVQSALISALSIPPEDFFQIIHVLPRSHYRHTRSFWGLNYSDDLVVMEITFISGRTKRRDWDC